MILARHADALFWAGRYLERAQSVLSYRLKSDPPARVLHTHDYWGTAVDHLGVRAPHTELELVAEASVETSARPAPDADAAVAELSCPDFRSEHFEFLEPSEHVMWQPGDGVARRAATRAPNKSRPNG